MNNQEFNNLVLESVSYLRQVLPRDTANLALFALRYNFTSENTVEIYIVTEGEHEAGTLDGIANYMYYVNELKTLGKSQKPNPNYKVWDKAIDVLASNIQAKVNNSGG